MPVQLCNLWDLYKRPKDLAAMELLVMGAMEWRIQAVTPAAVLDILACLLDFQGDGPEGQLQDEVVEDACQRMHMVRETSKLILAKALRGELPW